MSSNRGAVDADATFIEEVTARMMAWSLSPAQSRLFAYLLVQDKPASLDQIAADLRMSKSTASEVARYLERYKMAQRYGEPGTKRALYGSSSAPGGFFFDLCRHLKDMAELTDSHAASNPSRASSDRLRKLARFYVKMQRAIESGLNQSA
jgi:hypothetical protein